MIAEGMQPPQMIFNPETGKRQRVILQRVKPPLARPKVSQSPRRSKQLVVGDILKIIRHEPCAESRHVGYTCDEHYQRPPENRWIEVALRHSLWSREDHLTDNTNGRPKRLQQDCVKMTA